MTSKFTQQNGVFRFGQVSGKRLEHLAALPCLRPQVGHPTLETSAFETQGLFDRQIKPRDNTSSFWRWREFSSSFARRDGIPQSSQREFKRDSSNFITCATKRPPHWPRISWNRQWLNRTRFWRLPVPVAVRYASPSRAVGEAMR